MGFVHGHDVSKVTAIAVTLLMLTCSATMLIGVDAEGSTDTYDIYMLVDDTFTYTPSTNLDSVSDGTITYSASCTYSETKTGTAVTDTTFSFPANATKGASFSGTPEKAGFYHVVITATWHFTDQATQQKLDQSASQRIEFEVIDRIAFDGASRYGDMTSNIGISKDTVVGTEIFSTTLLVPEGAAFTESSFKIDDASFTNDSYFTYTLSNNVLKVKVQKELTSQDDKKFVLTFPASYRKTVDSQDVVTNDATVTVNVNIGDVNVTTDRIVTYVGETTDGQSPGFKTFDLQYTPSMTGNTWTVNSSDMPEGMVSFPDETNGRVLINTNKVNNDIIGANAVSKTYTFNVSVNGTYTSGEESIQGYASKTIAVEVYKKFELTSVPKVSETVRTVASTATAQDVLLETSIYGAKKLTYNWGDGKGFSMDVSNTGSSVFTANHQYAEPGVYKIRITAHNDFGDKSLTILYDTQGINLGTVHNDADDTSESSDKGFIEEHGWSFILFIVLAALAFVIVYIRLQIQHPAVLILCFALAIIGILCFNDTFGLRTLLGF